MYDALNVLMAMDIISKERKEIQWKGLPSSLQHDTEMLIVRWNYSLRMQMGGDDIKVCSRDAAWLALYIILQAERNERVKSLEQKKQHLQDLLVQVRV